MNAFELCTELARRRDMSTLPVIKGIQCHDGFFMSVQASEYHYCTPGHRAARITLPTEIEDSLMEYAEDDCDPTGTVYGYVPTDLVARIINKHGGMVK